MSTALEPRGRLTYDDFLRLPEDGLRHEIIDGAHVVSPSPMVRHQVLVGRLHFALERYVRSTPGLAQVLLSPVDVVLSYYDVVVPDLLVVRGERGAILTNRNVQGAPSLVVEVLSNHTRARDRRLKRDLYERCGVEEYWLVDPDQARVEVYRQEASARFGAVITLDGSQLLQTPLLPDFSLALAELFE